MSVPETYRQAEAELNAPDRNTRLAAVRRLAQGVLQGEIPPSPATVEVNNHVHTSYSFSPHSPSSAAWYAQRAGLQAVGIMDHDSVAGVEEMLQAGALLGIATTSGFEVRVNFAGTPFAGRTINGPGLTGIAYISLHGIPATQLTRCAEFLHPLQQARNKRNAAMVERLNMLLQQQGLPLVDFQRDVYAASTASEGGTVTERHILAALSRNIMAARGKGEALVAFLEGPLGISLPARVRGYLLDAENPHYLYDLLGVLKAHYTDAFFIHPDERECVNVCEVIALGEEVGAIPTYAYLGDVAESPTGDKKAEKFEDDFLDELDALPARVRLPRHHLHAPAEYRRATGTHPAPVRDTWIHADLRRGHQLLAASLQLPGNPRPALRKPHHRHLGAHRARETLHAASRPRPVRRAHHSPPPIAE